MAFAGQWQHHTIAEMPTQIYLPESAPSLAGKRALMISMGGCGQQAKDSTEFRDQSNWAHTAEEYGMVVAIPNAPDGGVLAYGCWDYYGANHSRLNRHNDNLLALVDNLLARPELNLDANQVYISGLSSGGAMVNVLLCLAPDVFAGGGNSAGPALGTTALQTVQVATDVSSVTHHCLNLAADKYQYLASQIVSLVWGSEDAIANPNYGPIIAESFVDIYGSDVSNVANQHQADDYSAEEILWSDSRGPRVSMLQIDGLGHAWPAGGGSGESPFMEAKTINYPALLTQFLFENNRRVNSVLAD